jgi:hypothetical protein
LSDLLANTPMSHCARDIGALGAGTKILFIIFRSALQRG